MTRHRHVIMALLLAATALPARAAAQQSKAPPRGFLLGIGGGRSSVRDSRTDEQGSGGMISFRIGAGVGRGITPMVEAVGHRLSDVALPERVATAEHVLSTSAFLASVQVELPASFYARPGVGSAYHQFVAPDSATDEDGALYADIETVPAASLALGRTMLVARPLVVAVEGTALWTRNGEVSGDRRSLCIQVIAMVRF